MLNHGGSLKYGILHRGRIHSKTQIIMICQIIKVFHSKKHCTGTQKETHTRLSSTTPECSHPPPSALWSHRVRVDFSSLQLAVCVFGNGNVCWCVFV